MARRATPGTRQLNMEISESLFLELEAFIEARGLSKRYAVERAIRRHLDNPPPILPDPPLPVCGPDQPRTPMSAPAPVGEQPAPKKKPKGGK